METAVWFTCALDCLNPKLNHNPLAGANLVGSDLYNKLSDYFIRHFQGMLQVSIYANFHQKPLTIHTFRKQKYSQTSISYDITHQSGTGTRQARITSTDCSYIWTDTGSNAKGMKERSGFSKFIQWVLPFIYHFHRINSNIARSVSVERTFLLAYPKRQCQTCNSHFASDCSTTKWRDYWPRPSEEGCGFICIHGSG